MITTALIVIQPLLLCDTTDWIVLCLNAYDAASISNDVNGNGDDGYGDEVVVSDDDDDDDDGNGVMITTTVIMMTMMV